MPTGEEKTKGELVEEIPPHHEIAEGALTEDETGLSSFRDSGARVQPQQTGKEFQLSACNLHALHQCHLDFSSGIPASIALHHWLSKQTDVLVKSSSLDPTSRKASFYD